MEYDTHLHVRRNMYFSKCVYPGGIDAGSRFEIRERLLHIAQGIPILQRELQQPVRPGEIKLLANMRPM